MSAQAGDSMAGRVALVTGGSRGVGAAICRAYAERGMQVALSYRADDAAAQATLATLLGEGHIALRGDISDPAVPPRLVDDILARLGRLDVLVNCAGIYEFQPFDMEDYDAWVASWRRSMDTNLMSAVNLTYCAIQHMLKAGSGKVIFISSRGAFRAESAAPAYAVSKIGMVAYTRCIAKSLARKGIRAYCIAPGWIETDMSRERMAPRMEGILKEIPEGRVAQPEDIAGVAAFLASSAADYLNGITIDVNGASYFH